MCYTVNITAQSVTTANQQTIVRGRGMPPALVFEEKVGCEYAQVEIRILMIVLPTEQAKKNRSKGSTPGSIFIENETKHAYRSSGNDTRFQTVIKYGNSCH